MIDFVGGNFAFDCDAMFNACTIEELEFDSLLHGRAQIAIHM
jgi:hypothetical protein